jgi:hypothetical protein
MRSFIDVRFARPYLRMTRAHIEKEKQTMWKNLKLVALVALALSLATPSRAESDVERQKSMEDAWNRTYEESGPPVVGFVAVLRVYTEKCETGLHDDNLTAILNWLKNVFRDQGYEKEYYHATGIVTRSWEAMLPEQQARFCDLNKDEANGVKQHWIAGDLHEVLNQLNNLSDADKTKSAVEAYKRLYGK